LPQDFRELIVERSWLNQFEHVIVGNGTSRIFLRGPAIWFRYTANSAAVFLYPIASILRAL
jgi:hypothetical protein